MSVGETIVKATEKNRGKSDFDVLPSAFVDGGKEANKFVMATKIIEKMRYRADKGNDNRTNDDFYHDFILTYF